MASTKTSVTTGAAALFTVAVVFFAISATSAFGAASYVFDPVLSLTGDCQTSPLDPVPDPGTCPGTPGVDHPSVPFDRPSVTTDAYGNIYVANVADTEGRISVFDPNGFFITEFADPAGAQSIAVDSVGNLYVFERISGGERKVRRFPPTVYNGAAGEIEYAEPPEVLVDELAKPLFSMSTDTALAVNPVNDQLFVLYGQKVAIFKSAAEGGGLLENEAITGLLRGRAIAIDAVHEKIYLADRNSSGASHVRVFELVAPYAELAEDQIDGSTTPVGEFKSPDANLSIDVDDETGHLFVGDFTAKVVYEFEEGGAYVATIKHEFERVPNGEIAIDDGTSSPRENYLFVPSLAPSTPHHVYAFQPQEPKPPVIESVSVENITETEAVLKSQIDPNGLATDYRFEYVSLSQFEGSLWNEATIAGEGTLMGGEAQTVFAPATGLEPNTAYRFRVVAESDEGEVEDEGSFATFSIEAPPGGCANDVLRTGFSALLPDCRAYELVTPPSTNGRPVKGYSYTGAYFPGAQVSPDGNRASFLTEGGSIPGLGGVGSFNGDPYLATRSSVGWVSEGRGATGEGGSAANPGSFSSDQTYSFWILASALGSKVLVRYPDGHDDVVGSGTLGTQEGELEIFLASAGGSHIVFQTAAGSAIQLEPDAPPSGTATIYDRTPGGTRVVSLLPGDVTPAAGQNAAYLGGSEDGEGIAFSIGGNLYLRLANSETLAVAGAGATFAGVAEGGSRVFYLEGGNLYAFDSETEAKIPFSSSGDVTLVNIADGGDRAYFVSSSVLTGDPNPRGASAQPGEPNLYLSEEGSIRFVGAVTDRDVEGEKRSTGVFWGGLGLWLTALDTPAVDPSRTSTSGQTLLFESRADLVGFDSGGFAQIYRYDAAEDRLDCVSCNPTEVPPVADASLQSIAEVNGSPEPASSFLKVANLSSDGKRAFFQTSDPLVIGDVDGHLDVYEWEAGGVGTCAETDGCVYLISGGHSSADDHLFGVSANGNDVFFRTADLLLGSDEESTLSLYDARVGGGFAENGTGPVCEGDSCHPLTPPPNLSQPTTSRVGPDGDVPPARKPHCRKGKRAVRRDGKFVCVKKKNHGKHRQGRTSGTNGKGGRK